VRRASGRVGRAPLTPVLHSFPLFLALPLEITNSASSVILTVPWRASGRTCAANVCVRVSRPGTALACGATVLDIKPDSSSSGPRSWAAGTQRAGQGSGRAHHRLEDVERKRFHREDDVWPAFHRGSQHVQEACLTCGARGRVRSEGAEDGGARPVWPRMVAR
jgi:hypothetical protein